MQVSCAARFPARRAEDRRSRLEVALICLWFAFSSLSSAEALPNSVGEQANTSRQDTGAAKVRAITRSGEEHTGSLLYVADSLLVLWTTSAPFNPAALQDHALLAKCHEIDRIVIIKKSRAWPAAGYGMAAGATLGVIIGLSSGDDKGGGVLSFTAEQKAFMLSTTFASMAGIGAAITGAIIGIDDVLVIGGNSERFKRATIALRQKALFTNKPPAALQAFIDQNTADLPAATFANNLLTASANSRIHLMLGGAFVASPANQDIIRAFSTSGFGGTVQGFFGPIDYPVNDAMPITWNAEVAISLTWQWRIGVVSSPLQNQEIRGKDKVVERARAERYSLLFEFVARPKQLFISRSEIAFAAGPSYNLLTVDGSLNSFYSTSSETLPINFSKNERYIGLHARMRLDYYLTNSLSLQCHINGRIVPQIHIPSALNLSAAEDQPQILLPHQVNFSSLDFSLGIGLHF